MTKYLTAKQKAEELGITTRGLAKTRYLYKHIQKSPRKFIYFKEEAREIVRPIGVGGSVGSLTPKPPRSHKRRNVPFGEENYHKCPGGSGNSLQLLNQMRAKASLEGKVKPEELKYLSGAMAIKIKDNAQEIVEQEQTKKRSELMANEEMARKKDPRRYGQIYNPKLVQPRYNKDMLNDQRQDRENMEKSFTDTLPGAKKSYY